jgi:hypothetical protein
MSTPVSSPFTSAPVASFAGEVVAWQLPVGTVITHADLTAGLLTAGLDPKYARRLCDRHAFVRACHKLAADRLIRNYAEDDKAISFQFTREAMGTGQLVYNFEAMVTLDKTTKAITCTDPGLQQMATTQLAQCLEDRKTTDVTRLLHSMFRDHADLFPIKGGVYFVPHQHQAFVDKVEAFLTAIRGTVARFAVPDGAGAPVVTTVTVERIVTDGMYSLIEEVETEIPNIGDTTRASTLESLEGRMQELDYKLKTYADYVGVHRVRLEDHLAYVAKLKRDRIAEVQASKEPLTAAV